MVNGHLFCAQSIPEGADEGLLPNFPMQAMQAAANAADDAMQDDDDEFEDFDDDDEDAGDADEAAFDYRAARFRRPRLIINKKTLQQLNPPPPHINRRSDGNFLGDL